MVADCDRYGITGFRWLVKVQQVSVPNLLFRLQLNKSEPDQSRLIDPVRDFSFEFVTFNYYTDNVPQPQA